MGVIDIKGKNPFKGQSDPYISSNMSSDGENATVDYVLNGQLTGCDLDALFGARDNLVDAFDWKQDPEIIKNINIKGIQKATKQSPLVPVSLVFENSSYKGHVGYTLTIRWSTKQKKEEEDDDDDEIQLINKTWTESIEEDEKGCTTVTTNMSCVPNTNIPDHCDEAALAAATKWISDNIGDLNLSNSLEKSSVDSESLTINPVTSEVKYTSVKSSNCENQENANTEDEEGSTITYTHCTESNTEYTKCEKGYNIVTTTHNGEVYKPSGEWNELMEKLNKDLMSSYDGVQNFNGSMNEGGSLTYSFTTQTDGDGNPIPKPKTMVINSQTISKSINYNGAVGSKSKIESSSVSVNGSLFWLNPTGNDEPVTEAAGYTASELQKQAKGQAGSNYRIANWSYSNDEEQNTANYGVTFNSIPDGEDPEEQPVLDGFSGVTNYSLAYTPSLGVYDLVPNMNCEDLVFKMGYVNKGSTTISVSAVSGAATGSGHYDFIEQGRACMEWLKRQAIRDQSSLKVTADTEKKADDDESATWTYSATFKAADALTEDGDQIKSMY